MIRSVFLLFLSACLVCGQTKISPEREAAIKAAKAKGFAVNVNCTVFDGYPAEEIAKAAKGIDGVQPEVVRSDEFLAKPMNVEEALMQMDLLNNDFLVFTRPETPSDVSVVYRRKDGNFGLIHAGNETTVKKSAAAK